MPTQTPPQRHPTTKGFTLIELMIVVVIIGILAAIAIPKFNSVARSSKEAEAQSILKQIYTLELRYKEAHDHFTTEIDSLEGGGAVGSDAKYYDFNVITSHPSGFCVAAAPSTPEGVDAGVSEQSIDADRVLYRTDDCT